MACDTCHGPSVGDDPKHGGRVVDGISTRLGAMSRNCLECHANMAGEQPGAAGHSHGLMPETLASTGAGDEGSAEFADSKEKTLLRWISGGAVPQRGSAGTLSCETCHTEHHGKYASLTELSNQQCQICHQRQFESFSHGHPSFAETGYPYVRRTHLFFDHSSHYDKHFEGSKKQFSPTRMTVSPEIELPAFDGETGTLAESVSCRVCHSTDEGGQKMLVNGYQQSCAACHEDSVRGGNPIPMLSLPSMPAGVNGQDALVEGKWPAAIDGAFPLSPLMVALLPDEAREAAGKLPMESADSDLAGNRYLSADTEDAVLIATAMRSIWSETWKNGAGALADRLRENGWPIEEVGREAENQDALFAGLSLDSLRAMLFPGYRMSVYELAFPALDREALDQFLRSGANSRSIGSWPKRANADLSPLLRVLLEQNPKAHNALATLDAGQRKLSDLADAQPEELLAAELLAWEIKGLFGRFRSGNGAELIRRLQPLQGGILNTLSDEEILAQAFYGARNDEAMQATFDAEFSAFQQGQYPAAVVPSAADKAIQPAGSGGDDDFGGDDNSGGGDDFGGDDNSGGDDDFGGDDNSGGDDDFGGDDNSGGDDDFGGDDNSGGDDDFGGDDSSGGDDDFGGGAKDGESRGRKPADDDFGGGPDAAADDEFGDPAENSDMPAMNADDEFAEDDPANGDALVAEKKSAPTEPANRGEWQRHGGWFFDSEGRHALSYVSRGHSDPLLRNWLDTLMDAASSEQARVREDAQLVLTTNFGFRNGVKTSRSGKCLKCHSVDVTQRENESPLYQINWYSVQYRREEKVQLTHFNHAAHFIAIECIECHQLADPLPGTESDDRADSAGRLQYFDAFPRENPLSYSQDPETTVKANDPHFYRSNFRKMDHQATCAQCHQPQLTGNSCLQCHSYHHRPRGQQ